MGTERLLADNPDVLAEIYRHVDGEVPDGAEVLSQLLPRCLMSPGWRQNVDRHIRRALCSLKGFPEFLNHTQAVNGL